MAEVVTLDGPTIAGLHVRDAVGAVVKDVSMTSDGFHEVNVLFPHDTVDTYKTTFAPDCFRESFRQHTPLMCWQHDLREPIGRVRDAQITKAGNELVSRFSKDLDAVPRARQAFAQLQDGTLTDFSHGFRNPRFRKHPDHEGVRQIVSAEMREISPVSVGSIPGAQMTSLRMEGEEEGKVHMPTIEEIRGLVAAKVITPEQGQAMLREVLPEGFREHLGTITAPAPTVESVRAVLDEHDGLLSAMAENGIEVRAKEADPDGVVTELAAHVRDGGAAAMEYLDAEDLSGLSENVRQALALFQAASSAADGLCEALGVREAESEFSDSPWSDVDDADRTGYLFTENDQKKFPVKDATGKVNSHAVAAAAADLDKSSLSDEQKSGVAKKLLGYYGKMKKDAPGSVLKHTANRDADDLQAAEEALGRTLSRR